MKPDTLCAELMRAATIILGDLWRSTPVSDAEWDKLKERFDALYYAHRSRT